MFGKCKVQMFEVKNQSSLSKSGSSCMFLQVKDLPFKGSSVKPRELMASLKRNMS